MHVTTLQVSGVRGFYGRRSANLSFTRPDGSHAGWTVLAGRNSSGKSTLLQAMGLVLSGPRATSFIPSLNDWISSGKARAHLEAELHVSREDAFERPTLFPPKVWMDFERARQDLDQEPYSAAEPEFSGAGLDSYSGTSRVSGVRSSGGGWFYAGYGPYRQLGNSATWRNRSSSSKLARQVSSLFDETIPLAEAVDWLKEQRLYAYEDRPGASDLINIMMAFLGHGLLPDGFQVCDVDSQGLWVSHLGNRFPLQAMSDGYRAVTALVVDIVRQMSLAYHRLELSYHENIPTLPYPGVVLVDEIEAHLHVSWQKSIGNWLKVHFPAVQFIVSTHSPYVCQSADPKGIILLPGPGEQRPPRIIEDDLYNRVIYGSGDDAVLTELFGLDTPYSEDAEKMRERLGDLEVKVLDGAASEEETAEYKALSRTLRSSLSARADEVVRWMEREQ
jgi:hypothetical protein